MEALVPVTRQMIGGEEVFAVNARDLHAFLMNRDKFATWIKDRIAQYGFIENHDFIGFSEVSEKPKGGRPSKDYLLTLDMAKELAMVERTERGRQARRYFIACERELHRLQAQTKGRGLITESPLDQYLHGMDRDLIVRELRFLTEVQKTVPGMHEHQAFLSALAYTELRLGIELTPLFPPEALALPCPHQEVELRPTDIARRFGVVYGSGKEDGASVNQILADLGFQTRTKGEPLDWTPTDKGWPFAVVKEVPNRSLKAGRTIRQLFWRIGVLECDGLRDALDRKGRERQARLALSRDRGQSALDLH
ncbi:antA/AntB antirepressor family protein [Acidithiobacillus caldus]|uniref:antA/AntB antirepressor family protein n=1 Tax=Acidithiobacillus caldus TaxID=33059 RepID=UPI001C06FB04|nr:antA/AntB antirepressor family protein [Acidithiobacillus caldus]MBU2762355.1 phage antirepressor Ant [Acidithiobacillus caldus]MBU2771852.1 phage antirepressor Ant [Acidithiobacillus caldus]MBU2783829.1 phage antirepressor Ant [Acidithiobacillus caldus]